MKRFFKSVGYAWSGVRDILLHEKNFKLMLVAALLTVSAMFYFPTERIENAILLVMIFVVLVLELINSVIERIMNFIHKEHHESIRDIKDLMAAIVLFVSFGALIIGLYILGPYLIS